MNRVVAGIVVVVVVAAIVIGVALFFVLRDDGDDGARVAVPAFAAPLVRADAVVMPAQGVRLSMPKAGVVSEVLVSANDRVAAGQTLARLDNEAALVAVDKAETALAAAMADAASLEAAIAKERELDDESRPLRLEQARFALQAAEERYLHLSGAYRSGREEPSADGAMMEAEFIAAIADAELAVRDAEEALLEALGVAGTDDIPQTAASAANVAARDAKIAALRLSIFDMESALEDAEDEADMRRDAEERVAVANALLMSAERRVDVAALQAEEEGRLIQDAYDDALLDWRMVHRRYLGITLTDDELLVDPDTLFSDWGVDLEALFDPRSQPLTNGEFADDPATRWDELKLFAWLRLHAGPSAIMATCEGIELPKAVFCMERDFDDAWSAVSAAREDMMSHELKSANGLAAAENGVIGAEQALRDAERALELVPDGRQEVDAARIESDIDAANAAIEELLDFPDDVKVAQAEANLDAANAALEALLPDDDEIELALQRMESAELEVEKLERGRDPLDEERREARLEAAAHRVALAEANLETALMALEDTELLAPFAGVVVAVNIDEGEEVAPRQVVVGLADVSAWELHTEDLDELSVVNLAEGDVVQVRFDALPDLSMAGSVERISALGESRQGSVTYTAEIRLSGNDPRLRMGMTASVSK